MDKISRSIIKFINKQPNAASCYCSLDKEWDYLYDDALSISELCSAIEATPDEVRAAVSFLVENNIAEYRTLKSQYGAVPIGFRLKHVGLHFKEFQQLSQKEKWRERLYGFISGVLISVIAGLIIWLVSK